MDQSLRFSWNKFPINKQDTEKLIIPPGCLYTPLHPTDNYVSYQPIECSVCGMNLSVLSEIDFKLHMWTCPICLTRNQFPETYWDMTPTNLPIELIEDEVDYEFGSSIYHKCFIFLLDGWSEESEFLAAKEAIINAPFPENSLVGLILYGTAINIYDLTFDFCPRSYVLRGTKNLSKERIWTLLKGPERFIRPLNECKEILTKILLEIETDPWSSGAGRRPQRCFGGALNIATALAEEIGLSGRIICLTSGPCTNGPGSVISRNLVDVMRSHDDLVRGEAPLSLPARRFYNSLSKRLSNYSIDVFSCSFDQTGVYEMQDAISRTGGFIFVGDKFAKPEFKESFNKIFLSSCYLGSSIKLILSNGLKVAGCIGNCISLKNNLGAKENIVGEGHTTEWNTGSMSNKTTLAFYFETVVEQSTNNPIIQFKTKYIKEDKYRIRVKTVKLKYGNPNPENFDQWASAILLARIAILKGRKERSSVIIRWIDRKLINLIYNFSIFQKNLPNSIKIPQNFHLFPQIMYYFRRSRFLNLFNNSPDETTYYENHFLNEGIESSALMIQPMLIQFPLTGPPIPVVLDITSIKDDVILLLDTYFLILVHRGKKIKKWVDAGYQNERTDFLSYLEAPEIESRRIINSRIIHPRFYICNQGDSKSRFLKSRVNPSKTYRDYSSEEVPLTDDVSFQTFHEHLVKAVVSMK